MRSTSIVKDYQIQAYYIDGLWYYWRMDYGDDVINGLFGIYVVIASSGSSDKQDVFMSILLKVSTA